MDETIKKYFEMKLLWNNERIMDENGNIKDVYVQPERSTREDLKICVKCKVQYEGESDYICNQCLKLYEPLPLNNKCSRCGALNSTET